MLSSRFLLKQSSPREEGRGLIGATNTTASGMSENKLLLGSKREVGVLASKYKNTCKAHRKGVREWKVIAYPERVGKVGYVAKHTSPTHITLMFRHDSVIAHNYYNDDRSSKRNHHQPQVYFLVQINKESSNKTYHFCASPFGIDNKIIPHSGSMQSRSHHVGYCDGSYSDDMQQALKADNLTLFLIQMSNYIIDGTNREDSYGESCRLFKRNINYSNVTISINNREAATLLPYVMLDRERAFNVSSSGQQVTMFFDNRELEDLYMFNRQKLIEQQTEAEK